MRYGATVVDEVLQIAPHVMRITVCVSGSRPGAQDDIKRLSTGLVAGRGSSLPADSVRFG